MNRSATGIAALLLLSVALVGCGSKDDASTAAPTAAPAATPEGSKPTGAKGMSESDLSVPATGGGGNFGSKGG